MSKYDCPFLWVFRGRGSGGRGNRRRSINENENARRRSRQTIPPQIESHKVRYILATRREFSYPAVACKPVSRVVIRPRGPRHIGRGRGAVELQPESGLCLVASVIGTAASALNSPQQGGFAPNPSPKHPQPNVKLTSRSHLHAVPPVRLNMWVCMILRGWRRNFPGVICVSNYASNNNITASAIFKT